MSGTCNINQGNGVTQARITLIDSIGNIQGFAVIPVLDHFGIFVTGTGDQSVSFGQVTRLYVVPNGAIQVDTAAANFNTQTFSCSYFLSGQATDQ